MRAYLRTGHVETQQRPPWSRLVKNGNYTNGKYGIDKSLIASVSVKRVFFNVHTWIIAPWFTYQKLVGHKYISLELEGI